ncbi:MAG: DNA methyltransferase, partial [Planctomycetes bacterium]|nr:DNA methyltransferase [Planctomycetota bacterium]
STRENRATNGGWVRYGEEGSKVLPILEDFLEPARQAGFGVHLKNIYNLYAYFIRWSLWKVFEHKTAKGPGIISFITASSYLDGDAFVGVREHIRRICDHIDIIDLGGEGRGTRKDENIFAIQTPVAIFVAWRGSQPDKNIPAKVRYVKIEGTKEEKLQKLDKIRSSKDIKWESISTGWQDSFRPKIKGIFTQWPNLVDLMPWQQSGCKLNRTWPIGPSSELLNERWISLVTSSALERPSLFKESRDRKITNTHDDLLVTTKKLEPISTMDANSHIIRPVPYCYRSFDRQWIIPDNRLGDVFSVKLWQSYEENQIYLVGLFSTPLGKGPALIACSEIPDIDCFRGSYGAKAVLPLYRNADATLPNLIPELLGLLKNTYDKNVSPEDFAGYIYAVLAHPEYTKRFKKELGNCEIRVPLTKDVKLFFELSQFGQSLIWLHTYSQRMINKNQKQGNIPKGFAKCKKAVSDKENNYPEEYNYDETTQTLFVGDGSFNPVSPAVYDFEVSGLKVVQSWLGYRMKKRSGRKSSPLDDIRPTTWTHQFTRELLELLWVLEKTIEGYPSQIKLFERVLESKLFQADELPEVSDEMRQAPKTKKKSNQIELDF